MIRIKFRTYTWEVDAPFSYGEVDLIKRVANVRANELEDALRAGDVGLHVALALIGAKRAGDPVTQQELWDSELGEIDLAADDDEEETTDPLDGSSTPDVSGNGTRTTEAPTVPAAVGD